ncbi:PucR family transcriptional regulator [Ornithinimicrobium sp. W1679]|uniref:PucR family transcriptional regulator n=1 Tax=unclassified Ornithinimicrobium TaxID=2615080 RepID=UPI003CEB7F38
MPSSPAAGAASRPEPLQRRAGELATRVTRRMAEEHDWFTALSPDDRSWVGLIAQGGISTLLTWYADGTPERTVSGDLFTTAPRALAQTISLRQALDLTRTAVATVEDAVDELVGEDERPRLREAVLRYSRDVAFAAADVYARAAEQRGGWDARLESLVVHAIVRGEADDTLASRAAELGWEDVTGVAVLVGALPEGGSGPALERVREAAQRAGRSVLTAALGRRLVCVLGGSDDPSADARALAPSFAPGPVVVGPRVPHLFAAGRSVRAALSACDALPAWTQAPRPVGADDLLPERALLGEQPARRMLVDRVYRPLRDHSSPLLETVQAYLDHGGALEATARALFLHPNTVRYRLRRAADVVGLDAHDPRDAWVLQVSLALGRMTARHRPPR